MIFDTLFEKVDATEIANTHLYFITRQIKPDVKRHSKVMDKYLFKVYQVDIDNAIREHFHVLTKKQLINLQKKKFDLHEYDVISDDTQQLFTYSMMNKTMAFNSIMDTLLGSRPQKINNLESILLEEELWAYSVRFFNKDENLFTFRKVFSGKVAMDEKDSGNRNAIQKSIRTIFNTTNAKLELIEGQTINLDKQIDCIYYDNTFFIIQKGQFEKIVGMEQEFMVKAGEVIEELKNTNMIEGLAIVQKQILENPSIHKKLVRLSKIGNYKDLNAEKLNQMQKVCERFGDSLKIKNDKLLLEDEKDIDLALKMLADYYKRGEVSGKAYATFAGKQIQGN